MVRIIGDVHGKYPTYLELIKPCDYSVQVGDLAYDYSFLENNKISLNHRFLKGNHDLYDDKIIPHDLGDYGKRNVGGLEFFFVRGAFSIDWKYRQKKYYGGDWPQTWFLDEELKWADQYKAFDQYVKCKTRIMLTHDCPASISKIISDGEVLRSWGYNPDIFETTTGNFLQKCFEAWQPEIWIFGHYHLSYDKIIDKTRFICLPELGYIDLKV